MDIVVAKYLHILSSTLLFGTGIGTAFYLFFASRTREVRTVAQVARLVVIADWCFTATTIVFQPASGLYLAHRMGLSLATPWLYWSIVLFLLATACWLPVIRLQIRMRDIAMAADRAGTALPPQFDACLGRWAALGVPALVSFLLVFFLMVAKRFPWE